jgi:proteasome lid subunit RPN8/RPN11
MTMQTPDVTQLRQEKLPGGRFPAESRSDFRLHFAPEVHEAILKHAAEDTEVEICGIVVGNWGTDPDGPFASVKQYIRCDSAAKKFAEVTFTHESWDHINREMDTKYSDLKIIGWYHSHPDFGIFLSDRDQFIQQHFFSGPGQIAFVVDPVRQLEGVFVWKSGATQLLDHYWVGSQIRSIDASRRPDSPKSLSMASAASMSAASATDITPVLATSDNAWAIATRLLGWGALFLMGWLLAGLKSNLERQSVLTGAMAEFGALNVMRTGLEVHLEDLQKRLDVVAADVKTLSAPPPADESKEAAAKRKKMWQNVQADVTMLQRRIAEVGQIYGLSPEEQLILGQLLAYRVAERTSGYKLLPTPPDNASGTGNGAPAANRSQADPSRAPSDTSSENTGTQRNKSSGGER